MKRTGSRKTRSRKYMPLVRIFLAVSILMMAILVTEYEVQRLQARNTAKAVAESVEVEPTRASAEGAARILTGETVKAVVKRDSANSTYKADNLLKNDSTKADYKITLFENTKKLYSNDRVNVRSGAGTDFDRLGVVKRDTGMEVLGVTDNGWYQVMYKDEVGYVREDLLQEAEPGVEYIFAGDSRTVQMSQAVKNSEYEWIAKVGEGYTFFSNEAVPQIDASVGDGSVIIINYGVNDLHNAEKYIKLINKKIDSWISAGATVYYAAVTPVSDYPTITNDDIEAFNSEMKDGLDSRVGWLDGYSYLQNHGFSTGDGLHYNETTYKSLYTYYVNQVAANKEAA
ncbi:SH3 domain-containing protein [Butyrivibrio sp. JL13D10]|uniref:SH3 domain-containing protein n=1 Tax=Butyrivibrio sp. JL13D10 TaxID=3236815 RepID=UPI0038B531D4